MAESAALDSTEYLFPDDRIRGVGTSELVDIFTSTLDSANDQTDGSDPLSDIRIDHAQDMIEQARDRLIELEYEFTAEQKAAAAFLDWRSREEKEADAAAEAASRLRESERSERWDAFIKPLADRCLQGAAVPEDIPPEIYIRIRNSSRESLQETRVLDLLSENQARAVVDLIARPFHKTYRHFTDWREHAKDSPGAWWYAEVPLTCHRMTWLCIARLLDEGQIDREITLYDRRPEFAIGHLPRWIYLSLPTELIDEARGIDPLAEIRQMLPRPSTLQIEDVPTEPLLQAQAVFHGQVDDEDDIDQARERPRPTSSLRRLLSRFFT